MRFIRLVIINLPHVDDRFRSWKSTDPEGTVVTRTYNFTVDGKPTDRPSLMVGSEIRLPALPELTDRNTIRVPEQARWIAERIIEQMADLIAIHQGCRRSLASPTPCVFFVPETPEEHQWLDETDGVEVRRAGRVRPHLDIPLEALTTALSDRWDGASLLSEALSQGHATGRFHDLMRFYERAFTRSSQNLQTAVLGLPEGSDRNVQRDPGWLVVQARRRCGDGPSGNRLPGAFFRHKRQSAPC